jgi:hypothetical protein
MPAIAWLIVAVVAGAGAWLVGWPAWQASRARDARDTNTERYLAWRGRASRGPRASTGVTPEERRRLMIGGALAGLAVIALVMFFAVS